MTNPSPSEAAPNWAIEKVRASLQLGVSVPEIENNLVARGFTRTAATAIVNTVLNENVRYSTPSDDGESSELLHRILSGIAAGVCVLLGYMYGEGYSAFKAFLAVLGRTICIWFAESLSYRKSSELRWTGWIVLVLISLYRLFLVMIAP